MYINPQFVSDVMRPMSMDAIMDNGVQELSGGELQRVAIVMCLGLPSDIYLVGMTCTLCFEIEKMFIIFFYYLFVAGYIFFLK